MSDKKKEKLKKKVWIISTIILLVYIVTLITNPTAWAAFIPIIIPAGSLTIGLPIYAITRYIKENKKAEIKEDNTTQNDNIEIIEQEKTKENDILRDKQYETVIQNECNSDIKSDIPKIKTKGTIH